MWFKNTFIYQFPKAYSLNQEQLMDALQPMMYVPCSAQEKTRIGFTSVLGHNTTSLVHTINGQHFVSLTREEKHIPADAIKSALQERIESIETKEQRTLRKKEKQQLKEDVVQSLLPRAFSRYSRTHALIMPEQQLLLVDAASHTRAEELLSSLRSALGTLPVLPLKFSTSPANTMTQWVKDGYAPKPFSLLQEAELKDPQESGAVVRLKQQELNEKEVHMHLEAGKLVEKLALSHGEHSDFMLTKDGILKRIKFSKEFTSTHDELAEDPAAHKDANFNLMRDELFNIVQKLLPCLSAS